MAENEQDHLNTMKASFKTTGTSPTADQSKIIKSPDVIDLDGIDDLDPIALSKDDLDDADYEQNTRQTRLRTNQSKSKYDKMNKQALINSLTTKDNEVTKLKKKKAEANHDMQKEKKSRIQAQHEMKQLRQESADLRAEIRKSQEEKDELRNIFKAEVEVIEERFAKAEKDWTAKISNSIYPSLPDNILRERFQELWSHCKDWVKSWYQAQITVKSMTFFETAISECASRQRSSAKDVMHDKLKGKLPIMIRMLGLAWLSRTMINHFLQSPFFAFGGQNQGALERFYERSKEGEE